MKRFLLIFLASVIVLSLAACGGKPKSADPAGDVPVSGAGTAQTAPAETPAAATQGSSGLAAPALIPGELYQLDEAPVVRGVKLAGNVAGSGEFNAIAPADKGIRCIFELNEWVEVTPDTDEKDGLAVWVFAHRDDPTEYGSAALSQETSGFAAVCDLPFDPDAEADAPRGSFYLNPDDCEAGYYDLVFALNGKATAVLQTRFYNEDELSGRSDAELTGLMNGLRSA